MELGLHAQLEQKQQLRMTPQLQQAIKLLQLSRMELQSLLRQEMAENPCLEEVQDPYEAESLYVKEHGIEQDTGADEVEEVQADERDMDNIDWEEYLDKYSSQPMPTNSYQGYSTQDLPGHEETLSTTETLTEHLLSQLRLSALEERQQRIGALIIGNLDDGGWLTGATPEEIAEDVDVETDSDEVEEVLTIIQEFDPVGVGARDLQECLKVQANVHYPDDETVHEIIEKHISDLERKSFSKMSRVLNKDKDEIIRAAEVISEMEPKPGGLYDEGDSEAQYITPDIYIHKDGQEYVATLNRDGLPKLKVSNYYKKQLAKKQEQEGEEDEEAQEYIKDKLQGAMWLIRSIHQRQSTIMKVTESIIDHQREFFEEGIESLKPMVLKDVADDIDMHESTVSRVTTNKYVHTPRGVFELKFFFNSSITRRDGEDLASAAVKAKIREIIASEDPDDPLSDSRIADKLEDQDNIDIARRTVAKYREKMGILSSTKRKQVF